MKTRDGFTMEAMMIKPVDFDPSRKYPVYEYTYSGPHAQSVRNGWRGSQYLWWQLLAQHGMIVWVCDNRSASGKGVEATWPIYKHFGELELRDLEDGLKWLTAQPYVDGSRVVLDGWSYGGFMTSYALTHSTMWSAGIAGGTVADWHGYFRESAGPGWVLVGDAGHFKDPTPGQGIADALRQVERLAVAIQRSFDTGTTVTVTL